MGSPDRCGSVAAASAASTLPEAMNDRKRPLVRYGSDRTGRDILILQCPRPFRPMRRYNKECRPCKSRTSRFESECVIKNTLVPSSFAARSPIAAGLPSDEGCHRCSLPLLPIGPCRFKHLARGSAHLFRSREGFNVALSAPSADTAPETGSLRLVWNVRRGSFFRSSRVVCRAPHGSSRCPLPGRRVCAVVDCTGLERNSDLHPVAAPLSPGWWPWWAPCSVASSAAKLQRDGRPAPCTENDVRIGRDRPIE